MLNSLLIDNYKNIRHLSIPKLGRVNLIWGKNNVGKSTLLEALSIYASNGRVNQLYEILKMRGEDLNAFGYRDSITVDDELNAFLPLVRQLIQYPSTRSKHLSCSMPRLVSTKCLNTGASSKLLCGM